MSFTLRNAALIAVALSGLLFGCATSQKIQVVQPGDQNLSCNAIKEELARLDKAQADIDSKKGSQEPMSPAHFSGGRVWRIPITMLAKLLV